MAFNVCAVVVTPSSSRRFPSPHAEREDLKAGSRKGKHKGYVDKHAGAAAPGQRTAWTRDDVEGGDGARSSVADMLRRERESGELQQRHAARAWLLLFPFSHMVLVVSRARSPLRATGAGDLDRNLARNLLRGSGKGAVGFGTRAGDAAGRDEDDDGGASTACVSASCVRMGRLLRCPPRGAPNGLGAHPVAPCVCPLPVALSASLLLPP